MFYIWIYFTGNSYSEPGTDGFLTTYDSVKERRTFRPRISFRELNELIRAIPSKQKTLILDAVPSSQLITSVKQEAAFALVAAASEGEKLFEKRFDSGGERKHFSYFTISLSKDLREK